MNDLPATHDFATVVTTLSSGHLTDFQLRSLATIARRKRLFCLVVGLILAFGTLHVDKDGPCQDDNPQRDPLHREPRTSPPLRLRKLQEQQQRHQLQQAQHSQHQQQPLQYQHPRRRMQQQQQRLEQLQMRRQAEQQNPPEQNAVQLQPSGAYANAIGEQLIARYRVDMDYRLPPDQSPWQVASDWVNSHQILPDEAPELGAIMREISTARVVAAEDRGKGYKGGNMPKLFVQLAGGQWAIFKPKWYDRDFRWTVEKSRCSMQDLHTSEIAAFHISRVLGFRKTPIAVGRRFSLKNEILPVARQNILDTLYFNNATNETCIYGHCTVCSKTDMSHTICVRDDEPLEGVLILMLPAAARPIYYGTKAHPWYNVCNWAHAKETRALVKDDRYCHDLLTSVYEPAALDPQVRIRNIFYNNTGLFLDLVDSGIFHYLVMNYDRKLYTVGSGPYRDLLLMLDNGKSFDHPFRDDRYILAPVWHCCTVRQSTYERLLLLQNGTLSRVVRAVLAADPISPVLTEPQYAALDRRLTHVLHEIQRCIDTRGRHYVFRYG